MNSAKKSLFKPEKQNKLIEYQKEIEAKEEELNPKETLPQPAKKRRKNKKKVIEYVAADSDDSTDEEEIIVKSRKKKYKK